MIPTLPHPLLPLLLATTTYTSAYCYATVTTSTTTCIGAATVFDAVAIDAAINVAVLQLCYLVVVSSAVQPL